MNILRVWRQAWRIAEMRLLFLALLVSVTAVTSVNFFTDRTERSMLQQATKLLGADVIVRSSRPLDEAYLTQAEELGLQHAEMISFNSVVSVGDSLQLSQIKAVSSSFPLRGSVETSAQLDGIASATTLEALQSGQAWAESSLFSALEITPQSEVRIGRSLFTLDKVLLKTPDQSGSVFQFSPQVLMPLADLPATGLLTPGSRARFSYLFAGNDQQVSEMTSWLKSRLATGERLETLEDGPPSVNRALERAQRFLNTAALLSVILAGAAIALTSYSFNRHETHTVAVLKTMGASRRRILFRYLSQLFLTSTVAALVGALLGFVIQAGLTYMLRDIIGSSLPAPSITPAITGLFTAWIKVLGFSSPQLVQLVNTSPVQIFQQQSLSYTNSWKFLLATVLAAIFTLMLIQTGDIRLAVFIFLGTLLAVVAFWLVSAGLLKLLKRASTNTTVRTLANADHRLKVLIVVFGIGLFSLLLLTALRGDLLDRWQNSIPKDAPNNFLINIQPDQVDGLKTYLAEKQISADLYPMIRGRLVAMKGKPVVLDDFKDPRSRRLLQREFNLSSTQDLPEANILLEGQWFAEDDTNGFSVEESVMERYGLALGDTMTFDIAGQTITQTITSTRRVNWDNLTPNFFVLAAPGSMDKLPQTFITSIFVPTGEDKLVPNLIKQYPSVSTIDISAIMQQVKELITKAAFAVQAIFAFTLIAGVVVLLAALQSQKAERRRELAILKTIGASRQQIKVSIIIEFLLVGAISGFLAGLFAMIASNLAAYVLFDLEPQLNISLMLIGMTAGALLVSIAGYLNLRPLLNVPPAILFQEHND
ncbi:FtsX-like permease family protein [Leucothrix sargassi]|nr:FtsX-like permease family protein [Leucothrix sargassi]